MSLLGRAAGRALAGAGSAISQISNKYIDEGIAANRAQMLADLQRTSALQTEKDLDAYRNTPERLAAQRGEKVKDVQATSAAQLEGEEKRAGSPVLRQGAVDTATAVTAATEEAKRKGTIAQGTDPLYLQAQKAIAAASRVPESSLSIAQAQIAKLELDDRRRLSHLYDQVEKISNDPKLSQPDKDAKLRPLVTGIQTIKAKTGTRDPEMDTETVVKEVQNPDGSVTKTTRKEVRKPGQKGSEEADPIRAAMDAAREAKKPKQATAGSPAASKTPLAEQAQLPPAKTLAPGMGVEMPLEAMPTGRLKAYTQTHPDYARAQAELERRRLAVFHEDIGPRYPNPAQR